MLRTLSIGAIIGIFVMLTGCQSEDQREAAQRRREAEAEQTLEDLFGGLAEALEESLHKLYLSLLLLCEYNLIHNCL